MITRRDDAQQLTRHRIIVPRNSLTVEVLVGGELAEGVVGHFLALALGEDAGGAAAHEVVFVGGDAVEGIGLGDLEAALVVSVASDGAEGIGDGDEAACG